MTSSPTVIDEGFGFDPADFTEKCLGCGKDINLLKNHARATIVVERVVPHFRPDEANGATSSRLTGSPVTGLFHDENCVAEHAKSLHGSQATKMLAEAGVEFPYNEDNPELQAASEAHNDALQAATDK